MIRAYGRGDYMAADNIQDSILETVKNLIGVASECADFDTNIMVHINSAIMTLRQIGIGPQNGFSVRDSSLTWIDYINDVNLYESVKDYIYLKVKIVFDPPTSSYVLEAMKEQIKELEWRLQTEKEEIEKERNS